VAYVAHLAGGGFCLCGADDRLLPVYVYNPGDTYDPANPSHQYVLSRMGDWLTLVSQRAAPAATVSPTPADLASRAAWWDELVAGRVRVSQAPTSPAGLPTAGEPSLMTLNVTSRWNQDPPYNSQCPYLTATEQTIVGCVATAMAQTMYYWKWPSSGEGNHTAMFNYRWQTTWITQPLAANPNIPAGWGGGNRLQWTSASGGQLMMNGFWDESVFGTAWWISQDASYRTALQTMYDRTGTNGMNQASVSQYADFASTTYRWDLMHDLPSVSPDSGDQLAAVVSYHAGISTYMHWGIWLSTAFANNARNGLVDHWRYDSAAVLEVVNTDRMTEEIQWLRPVMMGGASAAGGHEWVVMGYDKSTDPNRLFLMNIGWGGANEWHTCDSFFPNDQDQLTRIAPRDVVKFVGNTVSGNGSPGSPYRDLAEAAANAPSGATLIFKAGSVQSAPAPLVITRPLTLKGLNAVVQ
jgi:hypothetical protein